MRSPWDQLDEETSKAFNVFLVYLNLDPVVRSTRRAYQIAYGRELDDDARPPGHIRRWCTDHEWVRRAEAYDAHIGAQATDAAVDTTVQRLAAFRSRQLAAMQSLHSISMGILGRFIDALQDPDAEIKLSPQLLSACMKAIDYSGNAEARVMGVHEALELISEEFGGVLHDDEFDELDDHSVH